MVNKTNKTTYRKLVLDFYHTYWNVLTENEFHLSSERFWISTEFMNSYINSILKRQIAYGLRLGHMVISYKFATVNL